MSNPSHILIARNSRPGHNPSASLSNPTETHAAASGIFRSSGSPVWRPEEGYSSDDIDASELSLDDEAEAIELDPTFTRQASVFPGTVKIVVEATTFWTHKEILFFSSPFFEAALSGNWSETTEQQKTQRPASMSSVMTVSQAKFLPTLGSDSEADGGDEQEEEEYNQENEDHVDAGPLPFSDPESSSDAEGRPSAREKARARDASLVKLQQQKRRSSKDQSSRPDAVIVLKEERASTFHDFLKYIYPHLECTITWNNVEGLMRISHKLSVPSLQRECLRFLLTHAAGKPIKAMRIAELFDEEELYRESSRFVLDNPGGWSEQELNTLSQESLLKLEKRRNWFLERVLKIGLTMVAKEYQCCATCPDPATCAQLLEDKWKQAYHAVFRFGPPQPSMVFRYLRVLEGVSPPLSLTRLSCQLTAKAFIASLFDRMFSLGVRGSGTDTAPLAAAAAVAGSTSGPRRHFLFCSLKKGEPGASSAGKGRRSREMLQ